MAFAFNYWWLDTDNLYITVSFRQSVRNSVNFCRSGAHVIFAIPSIFSKTFSKFQKKLFMGDVHTDRGFQKYVSPAQSTAFSPKRFADNFKKKSNDREAIFL